MNFALAVAVAATIGCAVVLPSQACTGGAAGGMDATGGQRHGHWTRSAHTGIGPAGGALRQALRVQ